MPTLPLKSNVQKRKTIIFSTVFPSNPFFPTSSASSSSSSLSSWRWPCPPPPPSTTTPTTTPSTTPTSSPTATRGGGDRTTTRGTTRITTTLLQGGTTTTGKTIKYLFCVIFYLNFLLFTGSTRTPTTPSTRGLLRLRDTPAVTGGLPLLRRGGHPDTQRMTSKSGRVYTQGVPVKECNSNL